MSIVERTGEAVQDYQKLLTGEKYEQNRQPRVSPRRISLLLGAVSTLAVSSRSTLTMPVVNKVEAERSYLFAVARETESQGVMNGTTPRCMGKRVGVKLLDGYSRLSLIMASAVAVAVLVTAVLSGCASQSVFERGSQAKDLAKEGKYKEATGIYERLVGEGFISYLDDLLFLYNPESGKLPDPERYTKYLMQGATWEDNNGSAYRDKVGFYQSQLGHMYLLGQDITVSQSHSTQGKQYVHSSLAKDREKACYWFEKSFQNTPREEFNPSTVLTIMKECPTLKARWGQLGEEAKRQQERPKVLADSPQAEQARREDGNDNSGISRERYEELQRRWGNSPEARAWREQEDREQEAADRQYQDALRQEEHARRELIGAAAGALGQSLQNKGGEGAAGVAPPMSLGGASGGNRPTGDYGMNSGGVVGGGGNSCGRYDAIKFDDDAPTAAAKRTQLDQYARCMGQPTHEERERGARESLNAERERIRRLPPQSGPTRSTK
ncbi:MAG: hypothetical protein HP491_15645 [Nitrospira sp.]|nr:hypothetical protein [Nitrospira sp.]